jgi:hypothetical protein
VGLHRGWEQGKKSDHSLSFNASRSQDINRRDSSEAEQQVNDCDGPTYPLRHQVDEAIK